VIHCAGPFQSQDYRVALAAMAAGAHYLDLADGRQFVARFSHHVHFARARRGARPSRARAACRPFFRGDRQPDRAPPADR